MIRVEKVGALSLATGTIWDEAVAMLQNLARVEAKREAARVDGAVADVRVELAEEQNVWRVDYSEGTFTGFPFIDEDKEEVRQHAERCAERLREEIRGSRAAALEDFEAMLKDLRGEAD